MWAIDIYINLRFHFKRTKSPKIAPYVHPVFIHINNSTFFVLNLVCHRSSRCDVVSVVKQLLDYLFDSFQVSFLPYDRSPLHHEPGVVRVEVGLMDFGLDLG